MKTIYILGLYLILGIINCLTLYSQSNTDWNLDADTVTMPYYKFSGLFKSQVFLMTEFDGYHILNPNALDSIKGKPVVSVEILMAANHPKLDYSVINRKRLIELYKYLPDIFKNNMVHWRYVKQTEVSDEMDDVKKSQGMVITYLSPATANEMKLEFDYIRQVVNGKKKPEEDSTITGIFARNTIWSNKLMVIDASAGMGVYNAQIMVWLKSTFKDKSHGVKYITFFNGGDKRRYQPTLKGSIGGQYDVKLEHFETIMGMLHRAMTTAHVAAAKNTIESLMKGIKNSAVTGDIILVADNFDAIYDLSLVKEIKKPIHIVLCGSEHGINPDYMNLARATKGTLHLVDMDITDLAEKKVGDTITIHKEIFKLEKDGFVFLKNL